MGETQLILIILSIEALLCIMWIVKILWERIKPAFLVLAVLHDLADDIVGRRTTVATCGGSQNRILLRAVGMYWAYKLNAGGPAQGLDGVLLIASCRCRSFQNL